MPPLPDQANPPLFAEEEDEPKHEFTVSGAGNEFAYRLINFRITINMQHDIIRMIRLP